jgi:hypothetical protein
MDSNTTAGGGVPLLHLDHATASALQHLVMLALVVCVVVVIIVLMAFVINYFRGPKEGLEEPAGCFPGGGDDVGRAPQQQLVAAEAVAIQVEREGDAVPVVIICKVDDGGGRREPTCGVCLAELAGGGALRALSPCRHCFHSACAREWVRLHATCPLCQSPVTAAATV